jgi:hypothetical protein
MGDPISEVNDKRIRGSLIAIIANLKGHLAKESDCGRIVI